MAFTVGAIAAKDGGGSTLTGGLLAADTVGGGAGPWFLYHGLVDGVAGSNKATVTAANALKVDNSGVTQPVSLTSTTITGTVAVTQSGAWSLSANQSVNVAQINGITALMGNGVTGTGSQRVTIASDNTAFSVNAVQSGTWTVQPGNTPNTTAWKVQLYDGTTALPILAASSGAPAASAPAMAVSIRDVNANVGTNADGIAAAATSVAPVGSFSFGFNGTTWDRIQVDASKNLKVVLPAIGQSPKGLTAAFTTLTRPANTTAYTAGDSISNNATAGSVTALSATLSDTNDDPVTLTEILVSSTDTGLAGKRIRAYIFNSDPTASSGVVGGDNAAFSQKVAGYVGSFSGVLEAGFSDGTVGRLVPTFADSAASPAAHAPAGGFVVTKPTSGAKTIFIQFQAVDGFTPSASSTIIIGTARGYQGRAA